MSLKQTESYNRYYSKLGATEPIDWLLRRNAVGLPPQTLSRFLAKIKIVPGACWVWIGACFPTGYGMFHLGRRADGQTITAHAHRLAYELAFGPLESRQANHACNNPTCCNPGPLHIYAGTQHDNMQDRKRAGRYGGECPAAWKIRADLRRRIIAECLADPRYGTVARVAREHNLPLKSLQVTVWRARQRQFLAATTGAAAANR